MGSEISPEDRTTEVGLYHYALSYQECADKLRLSPPENLMFDAPVRYLFWHAGELLLKAYLRGVGLTLADLKKIGHSVRSLYDASVAHGLPLSSYVEAFTDFTGDHEPMEARYIVTGYKRQASLEAMSKWCEELRVAVRAEFKKRKLPIR